MIGSRVWEEGSQVMKIYAAGSSGTDETIAAWVQGHHSMSFPWVNCGSVRQPGKHCTHRWYAHTHA